MVVLECVLVFCEECEKTFFYKSYTEGNNYTCARQKDTICIVFRYAYGEGTYVAY